MNNKRIIIFTLCIILSFNSLFAFEGTDDKDKTTSDYTSITYNAEGKQILNFQYGSAPKGDSEGFHYKTTGLQISFSNDGQLYPNLPSAFTGDLKTSVSSAMTNAIAISGSSLGQNATGIPVEQIVQVYADSGYPELANIVASGQCEIKLNSVITIYNGTKEIGYIFKDQANGITAEALVQMGKIIGLNGELINLEYFALGDPSIHS